MNGLRATSDRRNGAISAPSTFQRVAKFFKVIKIQVSHDPLVSRMISKVLPTNRFAVSTELRASMFGLPCRSSLSNESPKSP